MTQNNKEFRMTREQMISNIINSKYSIDEQIALIRQKDTKPEEYQAFYDFAEATKAAVTAEYAKYEAEEAAAETEELQKAEEPEEE